jgi:predicted phosphoribosyltransferase
MFASREDAGRQLAERLRGRDWHDALVLAIPRGGAVVGTVLATELGAEFDVVLSRKIGATPDSELTVGAVAEGGAVYLDARRLHPLGVTFPYLADERDRQLAEIARQQARFRAVRPRAAVAGRPVILTDDGVATGATLFAALEAVRARGPRELIVAVPVAPPERLADLRDRGDEVVCLESPATFWAIRPFYHDFPRVSEDEVLALLREAAPAPAGGAVGLRSPSE